MWRLAQGLPHQCTQAQPSPSTSWGVPFHWPQRPHLPEPCLYPVQAGFNAVMETRPSRAGGGSLPGITQSRDPQAQSDSHRSQELLPARPYPSEGFRWKPHSLSCTERAGPSAGRSSMQTKAHLGKVKSSPGTTRLTRNQLSVAQDAPAASPGPNPKDRTSPSSPSQPNRQVTQLPWSAHQGRAFPSKHRLVLKWQDAQPSQRVPQLWT